MQYANIRRNILVCHDWHVWRSPEHRMWLVVCEAAQNFGERMCIVLQRDCTRQHSARDAVQALNEGAQPACGLRGGGHLTGLGTLAARQAQVVAAQRLVEGLDVAQHRERHVHSALEHLQAP